MMTQESAWDPSINPHTKMREYDAALAAGRKPARASGDFWEWLAEAYPNRKLQARRQADAVLQAAVLQQAQPQSQRASGNYGWDEIVAKLNAEAAERG